MMDANESDQITHKQKLLTTILLITTTLVGVTTLVIVLGSIFLGIWLDEVFYSRPAFTIGLVLASIPVSIICTIFIVKALIKRIRRMTDSVDESP